MTLRVGLGLSEERDALTAGAGAATEALARVGSLPLRLAFVLATPRYDDALLLEGVRSVTKDAPLIGGNTPLLLTSFGLCVEGVAVLLLAGEQLTCTVGYHPFGGADADAAEALAQPLLEHTEPRTRRGALLLGHHQPGFSASRLHPLQHQLGDHLPLAGGTLAVNPQRTDAALYVNDHVLTSGVAGLVWSGDLQVSVGAAHGWHAFGTSRRVTKTAVDVIQSLDGAPAAQVYADLFGDEAVQHAVGEILPRMTVTYPLGLTPGPQATHCLLRSVKRIDPAGALHCVSEVPANSYVRLMIASNESVINAGTHAASLARGRLRQVTCAIVLESWARYRLLGAKLLSELTTVQRVLGPQVPLIGGLTLAELVPRPHHLLAEFDTDVQNNTMLVVALGH